MCADETWERATSRLLRSGEWRVPTQQELNDASHGTVGLRICIKGYGVGTVRQFIKGSGWGFHSSHAVDMGVGGVVSIKLLRKKNGETPWLKSTGRGVQTGVGASLSVGTARSTADAQVRMAQLFMQRGNEPAALDVVTKALVQFPTDPHLLRMKSTLRPAPRAAPPSHVNTAPPAYAASAPVAPAPAQHTAPPPQYRAPTQPAPAPASAPAPPPPVYGMQAGAPPLTGAARKAADAVIEMGFSRKLVERVQAERYDCCELFYTDPSEPHPHHNLVPGCF